MRVSRHISKKEDVDFLLSLNEQNITQPIIMEMFGDFDGNGTPRFFPYDTVTIPKGTYGPEGTKNKNDFTTTVGLWLWNRYAIENSLHHILGYINYTLAKKTLGSVNDKLSLAVLEDRIDLDTLYKYIMKTQHIMPFVSVISPHITEKFLTSTTEINKLKKKLLKKYENAIKTTNEVEIDNMEKELKEFALKYLDEDETMDFFNSGARGSFDNNYKNMYIMKGIMKDPDPDKGYNVALSNYMEGISKEEYNIMCNSLAEGPYSRGRKTQVGGYWEKLFESGLQHVVLDEEGSDCGTKRYITVDMRNHSIKDWLYCYIVEGSNLVQINSTNMGKYKDKTVKIRFASMCESKTGICNKCIGDLPYKLNIRNIGTALSMIPSKLKNLSMKSFHDSQIEFIEMDIMKAFGLK